MSIEENNRLGDLLKYEADKNFCREVITIAKGENLKMGTILAFETGDECKMVSLPAAKGEAKNTDTAFGILLEDVDASTEAKKALTIARNAIVASNYVIFPDGATDNQKAKIKKDLEGRGILIRQSA